MVSAVLPCRFSQGAWPALIYVFRKKRRGSLVSYLPAIPQSQSLVLSRKEQKALARQITGANLELMEVQRVEVVERARVRALGGIADDAIDQAGKLADTVVLEARRNPLAGQVAADLLTGASRAMKERIDLANRRLG
jgi:hypothetical protein